MSGDSKGTRCSDRQEESYLTELKAESKPVDLQHQNLTE